MEENKQQEGQGQNESTPKIDRFKGVDTAIAEEIKQYERFYFREDKPVPFGKLKLYPATVKDYDQFMLASSCLTLNKNETVEGIRMTNLDFLLSKLTDKQEGQLWSYKLHSLFTIIFHLKNGIKCKKCGHVVEYDSEEFQTFIQQIKEFSQNLTNQQSEAQIPQLVCSECHNSDEKDFVEMIKIIKNPKGKYDLFVNEQQITSQDFNRLRLIIMYQNFIDYQDDSWVDPDLKKDYEERLEIEAKAKQGATATLERKVVGLAMNSNFKFDEIFDMTIRKFTIALGMIDDLINYKTVRNAQMSGLVSFPKDYKIEHWLYKVPKDMYGDSYKTVDQATQEQSLARR